MQNRSRSKKAEESAKNLPVSLPQNSIGLLPKNSVNSKPGQSEAQVRTLAPRSLLDRRRFKAQATSRDLHLRICHNCKSQSESHGERVACCNSCGQKFAPFYFFSERAVIADADQSRKPPSIGQLLPIVGLTAIWSEEE
jgi:hypothetical protein